MNFVVYCVESDEFKILPNSSVYELEVLITKANEKIGFVNFILLGEL